MGKGVEWALHACLELMWARPDHVGGARLAELRELPAPYLNKQLQALVRSGILTSTSGPRGGFTLARSPEQITFLDVVEAVEGSQGAFTCAEIRQRGPLAAKPEDCQAPCRIAAVMYRAENAWRRELARVTLEDLAADLDRSLPDAAQAVRTWLRR